MATKFNTYKSEDLILPYEKFPSYQKIEQIQPVSKIQPYYKYQGLDDKRQALENAKREKQTQTFLSNYNDPTELNSFIDALTNREAVSKKFGEVWGTASTLSGTVSVLSFAGAIISGALATLAPVTAPVTGPAAATLFKTGLVAAVPSIPAAIDVTYNKTIKPILNKKPGEAILNTLINLGETMDTFANPVKGLVLEGSKGFVKATGLSSEGRTNYDYDTGFFLTDILLEMLSDPINILQTIGTKVATKTAIKQLRPAAETVVQTIKAANPEITDDIAEQVIKDMTKAYTQVSRTWVEADFKNLAKTNPTKYTRMLRKGKEQLQGSLAQSLKKHLPQSNTSSEQIQIMLTRAGRDFKTGRYAKSALKQIENYTFDTLANDVIKNVYSLTNYTNAYEKFMAKSAMLSSGYGLGVEAVKYASDPIRKWQNEHPLGILKPLQMFDREHGIKLTKWDEAKAIWEQSQKYMSKIADKKSQRDLPAFYAFASEQFGRDLQDVRQILVETFGKPNRRIGKLNDLFQTRYELNFDDYIKVMHEINAKENNRFEVFIKNLEAYQQSLKSTAFKKGLKGKSHTLEQVFKTRSTSPEAVIRELSVKVKKAGTNKPSDNWYALKLNNADVAYELLQEQQILDTLTEISSSKEVGALLNRVMQDAKALSPEIAVQIPVCVRVIKEAGISYMNVKQLFDTIAETVFPTIKGITPQQFKHYILDQIMGLTGTVQELYAGFDNTLNMLLKGIEILCEDTGFKVADYAGLDVQIGNILKTFLMNQQAAGIENVGTTIVRDFTRSVDDLIKYMPAYKEDLIKLAAANTRIKTKLSAIKDINQRLLGSVSNNNTIFDVLSSRQLTDLGYARKIVGTKENLQYFYLPKDLGNVIVSLETLGKNINRIKRGLGQWGTNISPKEIEITYATMRKHFVKTGLFDGFPAFRYVKYDVDLHTKLALLIEAAKFAKTDPDVLFKEFFHKVLGPMQNYNFVHEILHPERLFRTTFAWEPMARAAAIAEQHWQEGIINMMHAYEDVSLSPKKFKKDYLGILNSISENKLDRPKKAYLQRYIQKLDKYDKFFTNFENYYYGLYDTEEAEKQIAFLHDMLLMHPRLQEEHQGLIDRITRYFRHQETFRQDSKEYIKAGIKPDGSKPIDEFTPFFEDTKKLNKVLAEEQSKVITQQAIKGAIPKELYNKWFVEHSDMGADLLDILNNTSRELTDHDYQIYYTFLTKAFKHNPHSHIFKNGVISAPFLTDYIEIAWEFIPAQFKEIDFKYYYDILGIDDPRMVLNLLTDSGIMGWSTHIKSANNIVGAMTDYMYGRDDAFKEMLKTYTHESGHTVLTQIFEDEASRQQYVNSVIERYKKRFGEEHCNYMLRRLIKSGAYNETTAKEEIFTRCLAREMGGKISYIASPPPMSYEKFNKLYEEFSQELVLELHDMAKPLREKIKENYNTFFKGKLDRNLRFNTENIQTVNLWAPFEKQQQLNKVISRATDRTALIGLTNVLSLSPDEFVEELAHRARFITFTDADLQRLSTLKSLKLRLTNALDPEKVFYHYDQNAGRYWYVLRKEQATDYSGFQTYLNGNPLTRKRVKQTFNEFSLIDDAINDPETAQLVKTVQGFNADMEDLVGTHIGDSQGEIFNEDMYNTLLHRDKIWDVPTHIPEEVWKEMDGARLGKSFFENTHFNESILGTAASKRQLGMFSSNIIKNMHNTLTLTQHCLKPKIEYVTTTFDSMFSIGNKTGVFGHFTDEELLEALRMTDKYKLLVIVDDAKYGVKVRTVLPTSIKAISEARRLGGVIVSNQVAKNMYNIVNHRLGSTGFAKIWSRIMYVYKFGYLCRLGSFIRNAIDTHIKSALEMKSETTAYLGLSYKICKDVDNLQEYLHVLAKENPHIKLDTGLSIKEHIAKWFADGNAKVLTHEQYLSLKEDFFEDGISGNIMRQLLNVTEAEDSWELFAENLGKITDLGNKFETPNRLAVYLYNLDKGLSYNEAMSRLAKVHFDYGFKTKAEQLVDMIFPFTTFSLRNYSYWVEALDNHPWLLRNYVHIMKPSWDFKDYTPEELATDYRVQAQIRYGQIKIAEFNDKVLTFKANPSIQDAIQMFSDPINNVYEKLAAPIAYPLSQVTGDYTQPLNMLPIIGPTAQMVKGLTDSKPGFSLSAMGVIPKRTQQTTNIKFSNKNYSGINSYKDSQYRVPTYRKNVVYDSYATKGITKYRTNMFPIVDVYHDIKSKYTVNVYNRIKNQVKTDVYRGIRYSLKLDVNRWR